MNLIDRQKQVYMWSNKKPSVVARELNEISMSHGWMRRFLELNDCKILQRKIHEAWKTGSDLISSALIKRLVKPNTKASTTEGQMVVLL
jgi:hypothetical protein